ncbi:hypothetical protein LZ31DRAFT_595436 [Colletotrichum somersetense]|nr:hypothetical protein LZ31DRAFT_595436 [Colletotrichum somersetense]
MGTTIVRKILMNDFGIPPDMSKEISSNITSDFQPSTLGDALIFEVNTGTLPVTKHVSRNWALGVFLLASSALPERAGEGGTKRSSGDTTPTDQFM